MGSGASKVLTYKEILAQAREELSNAFVHQSSVVQVIQCTCDLCGLTVVENELFVAQTDVPEIQVYNLKNIKANPRTLKICDAKPSPYLGATIAGCSYYKCIYVNILDFGFWNSSRNMYRVELSDNSISKWKGECNYSKLYVTRSHNLLINVNGYSVGEYTTHGELLRKIYVGSTTYPLHCVRLSSGAYVACYGSDHKNRISVLQTNTAVGGRKGIGMLIEARVLAVDDENHIFASDKGNSRIHVFNPQLKYIGQIGLAGYKLDSPIALHFDEINNRLYIGEYCGRVLAVNVCITDENDVNQICKTHQAAAAISQADKRPEIQLPSRKATTPISTQPGITADNVPLMMPEITGGPRNQSEQIFISYCWGTKGADGNYETQEEIIRLFDRLTQLGYSVWLDIKKMGGGCAPDEEMQRGIEGCKVFLSCVTTKYTVSENCRREVKLADSRKKTIVPLLLEKIDDWPPQGPMAMVFVQLLYINFILPQTRWSGNSFDKLLQTLSNIL